MLGSCDIFRYRFAIIVCAAILLSHSYVDGGAVPLTHKTIDDVVANHELVFINFYAEWCRFSNILAPIFDEAADKVREIFPEGTAVLMGKVDCDAESSVAAKYHINKYPTLKVLRNGQPTKREYRGQRSVDAFVDFVKKQMEDPIKEFSNLHELSTLDDKKRMIIGYFERKDVPEYGIFRRVASNLKEDCQFHVGFGESSKAMHPPGESIVVFRSDKARSNDDDETFKGSLKSYDELNIWAHGKCVPLVREITFENAEELTEEGLPFLILFHAPDDLESVKAFKSIVATQLLDEKQNVNFLTADGHKFAHPLHHLDKKPEDLPLIAIDSFRHMYLYPRYEDIFVEGALKSFLNDLHSGKLHRDFHYGPDPNRIQHNHGAGEKTQTAPPESTFKKLAPSKNRYTLLKDEL